MMLSSAEHPSDNAKVRKLSVTVKDEVLSEKNTLPGTDGDLSKEHPLPGADRKLSEERLLPGADRELSKEHPAQDPGGAGERASESIAAPAATETASAQGRKKGKSQKITKNGVARSSRRLALSSACLGAALALSYAESFIPAVVPGAKLGLANAAVLFTLYRCGAGYAFAVSMLRVSLCALLFGGSGFAMSFSGALLSFAVMWPLSRLRRLSPVGVSVAGAAAHNTAQVIAAALLTGSEGVTALLTPLLLLSLPTGTAVGITVYAANNKLPPAGKAQGNKENKKQWKAPLT